MNRKNSIAVTLVALIALLSGCFPTKEEHGDEPARFLSPSVIEVVLIDAEYPLCWSAPGFGESVLLFSSDTAQSWEVVDTLRSQEVAAGSMSWLVPNVVPTSAGCMLRLVDTLRADTITSALFTITGLQIVSPRAGEILKAGQTYTIVWKTFKYTDVLLYLSSDGGFSYDTVPLISKSFQPTWQSFPWTVPNTITSSCDLQFNRYSDPDEYFFTGRFSIQ
jgi:hypothetical protein